MERVLGTISRGIRLPIIESNIGIEKLSNIIIEQLEKASIESNTSFKDKDIVCITESIIARAENNYISIDDIAEDIKNKFGENQEIILLYPIYSRNRFSMILKGIARAASKIHLFIDNGKDEVGNDIINPFTGINIEEYYKEIIESEKCECHIYKSQLELIKLWLQGYVNMINCKCHSKDNDISLPDRIDYKYFKLNDICCNITSKHGYNEQYGLLGSNKATEEKLKLFPRQTTCKNICENIQQYYKNNYNINIEVMVYGDGCFKDPIGEIWEFADPVVSPYFTNGINGTPNEIKIKYIADNESSNKDYIKNIIKNKENNLKGKMISQGTTPRRYCDLIGSLADLTSGSGDKGTPVIWISGYFDNYNN